MMGTANTATMGTLGRGGRRFVALVLAFLFLLQSAAQAGSGCLPSVFNARCCCESVDARADVSIAARAAVAEAPHRSCCMKQSSGQGSIASRSNGQPAQEPGLGLRPRGGCHCELAPLPSAPSDVGTSWFTDGARDTRVANLIARGSTSIDVVWDVHVASGPASLASPPGSRGRLAATSATTRLAQRGVIGLLSDLGTFLE